MTDTIPTNAAPSTNADLGAVTWHPSVVKLRELFFDVFSFELQRFTALGDGASFLCWCPKDGSIAWVRLDLFAKPTRDNPRQLVLRVVINKGPVDDVANVARRRGLLVENEPWRSPSWALEAFVTLDELLGSAPFLASLVRTHEKNDASLVIAAPFKTVLASGAALTWDVVASEAAWAAVEPHVPARSEPT
ncbi:MAG: hypothetical protein KIT84_16870 [Labilithrix sp.]|nr:hypothetical protein [Labilithrix sp.]MCW5812703.1 hypothetical protein [Labilithrix sp.]